MLNCPSFSNSTVQWTSEDRAWLERHGAAIMGDAPLIDGGLIEASAMGRSSDQRMVTN